MPTKLTLMDAEPNTLPDRVELVTPIQLHWDVVEVNEGDQKKLRRKTSHHPIRIVLREHLGTDCILLKLKDRAAGFDLKITFSIQVTENGNLIDKDILEVDLSHLIPDDVVIGPVVELHLLTHTTPEFVIPA